MLDEDEDVFKTLRGEGGGWILCQILCLLSQILCQIAFSPFNIIKQVSVARESVLQKQPLMELYRENRCLSYPTNVENTCESV